jgi:hypothetical protein
MKKLTIIDTQSMDLTKSQVIKTIIGGIIIKGFDETGNNAFYTEDLCETKIFKQIGAEDLFVEASFSNKRTPAFNVCVLQGNPEQLKHYIQTELNGWVVKNCQFDDINIVDNRLKLYID